MKKINFVSVFLFVFTVSFAQRQEIKLPLTFHNRLSIHSTGFSVLNVTKELSDTSQMAKGCSGLTNLRIGTIDIYPKASITGWDSSFRSSVQYVLGIGKDGREQLIIDKNNNSDFSDDSVLVVSTLESKTSISPDKFSKASVEYDWSEQGKKVKRSIDIHFVYQPKANMYFYTFAHYATAMLNGKKIEIVGNKDLSYLNYSVFNDSTAGSEGVTTNKYIKNNDEVYRINDLDINENVLILEKDKRPFSEIESPQIGFRAPAFTETDLITKEMVSLEKYRGKYVYLDIWTTWCGACIEEMPNVKEVYDKADRSKIEFIGIVGKDTREKIDKIINKIGINWKLVEANSENIIFNKYKVRAFPTTLLIDPNGIVIKSGLRAEELKRFIENGFSDVVEK
ncbi:MAG: TlpA family protein disulfide reductase [Paludibacter sp.]|nr:TlpA family protein disulfide reductase [Paludibacter sp.]